MVSERMRESEREGGERWGSEGTRERERGRESKRKRERGKIEGDRRDG